MANAARAVNPIEAHRPCVADDLILADELKPISVLPLDHVVDRLLDHLRQSGRVQIIDQVARGNAVHRLGHAVAVAVVKQCDGAAIHRLQLVLRVVGKVVSAGVPRVAVSVVSVRHHHAAIGDYIPIPNQKQSVHHEIS